MKNRIIFLACIFLLGSVAWAADTKATDFKETPKEGSTDKSKESTPSTTSDSKDTSTTSKEGSKETNATDSKDSKDSALDKETLDQLEKMNWDWFYWKSEYKELYGKFLQLEKQKKKSEDSVQVLKSRSMESEGQLETLNQKVDALNKEKESREKDYQKLEEENKENKAKLDKLQNQFSDLEKGLKDDIDNGNVRIKRAPHKLVINLDDRITFSSGSFELKKDSHKLLKKISNILDKYKDNHIYIEGHTDDIPFRPTREIKDNWELSLKRSLSVLRHILDTSKISPERISASGFGEHRPIVKNNSPENRVKNRRVDIVLMYR